MSTRLGRILIRNPQRIRSVGLSWTGAARVLRRQYAMTILGTGRRSSKTSRRADAAEARVHAPSGAQGLDRAFDAFRGTLASPLQHESSWLARRTAFKNNTVEAK